MRQRQARVRDAELASGKEHTLGMVMRLAQHQRAMEILGPIQEPVYPGVWGPRKRGPGGCEVSVTLEAGTAAPGLLGSLVRAVCCLSDTSELSVRMFLTPF